VKAITIVDEHGQILAAQVQTPRQDDGGDEPPTTRMQPLSGQRVVEIEVPDELEELTGQDLHRFFARVEISSPATVSVPRIEVVRERHSSD
jgi:hypothetical protein